MAKVTVYLSDDQLERLKQVKGFGRGGISKMFQAFVDSTVGDSPEPTGRYDYARKLMPTHAAIERHRRRLARKVQTGGPPADGGPVAAALTVLLYRRLLEQDPTLAATFEKEFARFGLDELVATETDGVDLLAEPSEEEEAEEAEEVDFGGFAGLGTFGLRIGDEVREAMRQVNALKHGLRDLQGNDIFLGVGRERGGDTGRPRARRGLVVKVSADDDPRDVLSVRDFTVFQGRHNDWVPGGKLTPSQIETVRELLIKRAGGDPEVDDDDSASGAGEGGADE
jgi:hypothetical protein